MAVQPVRVEGLAELRRGLKSISRELAPELRKAEAKAASVIATAAATKAPRGTRALPKNRRLRLHEAVRPLIRGNKIFVGATARTAPHANVNHWGGTIAPRGKKIYFKRSLFVVKAMEEKRPEFIALLGEQIQGLFRRNGFH